MNSIYFYETRIGRIGITDNGEAVTGLIFAGRKGAKAGGGSPVERAEGGSCGADAGAGSRSGEADAETGNRTIEADAARWGQDACPGGYTVVETALIKEAAKQLKEYLDGKRKVFDIPLALEGTPFQKSVWKALQDIPYGETRSYGEIAESIGQPRACRAVGMANNKNPIAIFVPCHRVIGSDGKLVGYASGLDIKERLLAMEGHTLEKIGQTVRVKKRRY